jgi:hypothetical protein
VTTPVPPNPQKSKIENKYKKTKIGNYRFARPILKHPTPPQKINQPAYLERLETP